MDGRGARDILARFGFRKLVFYIVCQFLGKVVHLRCLKGMILSVDDIDASFLEATPDYEAGFLDAERCLWLARNNPGCRLTPEFVAGAYERGDRCYAFCQGDVLASYGWYSHHPDRMGPSLSLHFGPTYIYMYKGFTAPEHRGKRLHAKGMAAAVRNYTAEGYHGLISYVEAHNYASLHSTERLGFRVFGTAAALRVFGIVMTHHSRGCRAYQFRIERTASQGAA